MEDILELVNRRLSVCLWNLPSKFQKPQLKDFLEQKHFRVSHIVVLQGNGCSQAVVQLIDKADATRLLKSDHQINGMQLRVTSASPEHNAPVLQESAVFKSVDAIINPAWMQNKRFRDAVESMEDLTIEHRKDGLHLIAPLQKIVQIEKQLKSILTAKRADGISVAADTWKYIQKFKKEELCQIKYSNTCRFVDSLEGTQCYVKVVATSSTSTLHSGVLDVLEKLCSSTENETERREVPLNGLPAGEMEEHLKDICIEMGCLADADVAQRVVRLYGRREDILKGEEKILNIIRRGNGVRPKEQRKPEPKKKIPAESDSKDKWNHEPNFWEEQIGCFKLDEECPQLVNSKVTDIDSTKRSTMAKVAGAAKLDGWEVEPKKTPTAKLDLKDPLPQRGMRKTRPPREVYSFGTLRPNEKLQDMDMTDVDLQLINQMLDDDITNSQLYEKPYSAKPSDKLTAAKFPEEPTAAKIPEEPTAAKSIEEPNAHQTQQTSVKTFEVPMAQVPHKEKSPSLTPTPTEAQSSPRSTARHPLTHTCNVCFDIEPTFTCICDFEVCGDCKELNKICPSCGEPFREKDVAVEMNLVENEHGILSAMRQNKMTIPGSAGETPMRLRVVASGGATKIFWLPDSREARDIRDMMTQLMEDGKLFSVDQAAITFHVEVKTALFGARGFPDATYLSRVTEQLKEKLQE